MIRTLLRKIGVLEKLRVSRLKMNILLEEKRTGKGINYDKRNLILSERSVVFIHIPKAAGMSVVDAIFGENTSNHATANDYLRQNESYFKERYSFSIVRNPFARLFSAYTYLSSGGMNSIDKAWYQLYLSSYSSFEDFVVSGGLEKAIRQNAEHFIPQSEFIFSSEGVLLVNEYFNLNDISQLELKLSEVLGKDIVIQKRNVTTFDSIDYNKIYTEEMKSIVRSLYARDFELIEF